ncbi:hypothetical protein [Paenibacillus dendritiformis]|uniref:hypothetical protein n=1 Tax=Paenibacillus dendritiformis TaxID=130049 RepID=UPI00387E0973
MKIVLDLNEVEIELVLEALKDKSKENKVTYVLCSGVIKHIEEKAAEWRTRFGI